MPRVADHFLKSIVYLYASVGDAEVGGVAGGTGFLVSTPGPTPEQARVFVATNSHVAVGARAIRFNMNDGTIRVAAVDQSDWHHHLGGHDVAVCVPPWSHDYDHRVLPQEFFFSDTELAQLNFGAGDDVFFMGRFAHHAGRGRNQPVVRFGTVALVDAEPVLQVGRDFKQESILIDGRSAGGFSGSPVFLYVPPFSHRFHDGSFGPSGELSPATTAGLIGVVWGHFGSVEGGPAADPAMLAAVPVSRLVELLESDEVQP